MNDYPVFAEEYSAAEIDEYLAEIEMDAHGPPPPPPMSRDEQENADRAAEVAAEVAEYVGELNAKVQRTSIVLKPRDTSCAAAPWCLLLDATFAVQEPFAWRCSDMLSLRATCSGIRGGVSSRAFAGELLNRMGWAHRPDFSGVPLSQLYRLCDAFRFELEYVRRLSTHGRFPGACCVAGSHALHRMMLLQLEMSPGFWPSDIDVFVSDPDAFSAVVDLSKLFLEAVLRLSGPHSSAVVEEAPTRDNYGALPLLGQLTSPGHPFPLARVLAAMDYFRGGGFQNHWAASQGLVGSEGWMPAFTRLPAIVGHPKAHTIRRCLRVRPPRGYPVAAARVSLGLFVLPHNLNVVLLSFGRRTRAERVVDGFDMHQCKVVMGADGERGGGFAFTCSETTRHCAADKQIRLTRFAFNPLLRSLPAAGPPHFPFLAVLKETIRRVRKYEAHGFHLVEHAVGEDETADGEANREAQAAAALR